MVWRSQKWSGRAQRKALKDWLPHALLQQDGSQNLKPAFCNFLKTVTSFAHVFTSEVCSPLLFEVHDASRWGPNNVVKNEVLDFDWRGRGKPAPDFKNVFVPTAYDIPIFGTSLDYMVENDRREEIHVDGFFLSVSPIEETQRETWFTTNELPTKESTVNSIRIIMFQAGNRCSSDTKKVVHKVCRKSKVVLKPFELSSRQVMSA